MSAIDLWRKCHELTLSDAALLLSGNDPDEYSPAELLTKPPPGFKAIYSAMLSDAVAVIEEHVQSEEDSDSYYTLYALMTDKPTKVKKLSSQDGLNIQVGRISLEAWAMKREIGLGLLSSSITTKGDDELGAREQKSLHRIIGALKQVVLEGQKGKFNTQTDLVLHLSDEYRGYEGVSKSKLEEVFAEANRLLKES